MNGERFEFQIKEEQELNTFGHSLRNGLMVFTDRSVQ